MAGAVSFEQHARVTVAVAAGRTSAMDAGAERILRSVKSVASGHRLTGNYIRKLGIEAVPGEQGTGRHVDDRLVVADDPAAASIEWGHLVRINGARRVKWVPGQHPMQRGLERVR